MANNGCSHWYAVYVVTRHEKAAAHQLDRKAIETFLPTYHSARQWGRRKASVEFPLFPSYLFVRIGLSERLRVLEVPSVVHIVSSVGLPVAVPDDEIEALRAALQLRRSIPCDYISEGQRVSITEGPLRGLQGVVVRQNSRCRIIVSVDFIRRSTSVELYPEDIQCLAGLGPNAQINPLIGLGVREPRVTAHS